MRCIVYPTRWSDQGGLPGPNPVRHASVERWFTERRGVGAKIRSGTASFWPNVSLPLKDPNPPCSLVAAKSGFSHFFAFIVVLVR